jgi:uncharacterized protein YbcI
MPESGELRAALSNALVALMKEHYGKGPTAAKSFINDEYVFTVLEGGLTRNEETLLAAGQENIVRDYRLKFQQVVRAQFTGAVERLTGRRVLDYHSQIVFDPPRSFELFVLDGPPVTSPGPQS